MASFYEKLILVKEHFLARRSCFAGNLFISNDANFFNHFPSCWYKVINDHYLYPVKRELVKNKPLLSQSKALLN